MSTRGAVGIKQDVGWVAVYNHWDSYPTGLGQEVWQHLQGKDLHEFAKELLSYGDWREYLNEGVCKYCGKKAGQPHSISGHIDSPGIPHRFGTGALMRHYFQPLPAWQGRTKEIESMVKEALAVARNIKRTGYPDPTAKHHMHGSAAEDQMTQATADPLFIEWVYVIDPDKRTMAILAHENDGKTKGAIRDEPFWRPDGFFDHGHCAYRHVLVTELSLDGDEPDWEAILMP